MPLNAEVSFTWVGHGTWKVRSAKWKEIIAHKPKVISNFEITSWLGSKGVDASTLIGGNTGGTIV